MTLIRKFATSMILTALLLASLLSVHGSTILAQEARSIIFFDDFADEQIGASPSKWRLTTQGDMAEIEVVPAPELKAGRAVRFIANTAQPRSVTMRTHPWEIPGDALDEIAIDLKIQWVRGRSINLYVSKGSVHHLHWSLSEGNLGYRSDRSETLARLEEGWNHIRLVANRATNETLIYLNDMNVPLTGPKSFRSPIDSWVGAELIFAHTTNLEIPSEAIYGEIQVGVPENPADFPDYSEYVEALEWNQLDAFSPEEWGSREAVLLARRLVQLVNTNQVNIGLPLGQLSITDGLLPTQLQILARVYAAGGERAFKDAFVQGVEKILAAQFPSGGWPTQYPRFYNRDLYPDVYAGSTWDEVPQLLQGIVDQHYPFDTDIAAGLDVAAVEHALSRIPLASSIVGFTYQPFSRNHPNWWQSEEAIQIGDNLITWQIPAGGWPVDTAMHVLSYDPERMIRAPMSQGVERGSFDDQGTVDPMRFLARLYSVTGIERFKASFDRGLDYVLEAQYETGGWPQQFPNPTGYGAYVTFNDDAMQNIMSLLQDIVAGHFPFEFIDDKMRSHLKTVFAKGLDYILKAQIEVDGRLTAWGQQHDPYTYEPRTARTFEPIGISGLESVSVVELLQSIPEPSVEVNQAIVSALEWFEAVQLPDGRWARFYEIGTNRPIFAGREGIVRYDVSEIEEERQRNYGWFGRWPHELLIRAQTGDYLDYLYASVPDHPSVRAKFVSPRHGATVTGSIPLEIELFQENKAEGLERVTIVLDDTELYDGTTMPESGTIEIDTEAINDGGHTLTITMIHRDYGTFTQSVQFVARNIWRILQEMQPPLTSLWFGSESMDFLRTAHRSEGWGYDVDNRETFFGDGDRLVRVSDETQYLVWETPRMRDASLTLFVQSGTDVRQGVQLSVSHDGDVWKEIAFETETDGSSNGWDRVRITVTVDDAVDWNWFQVELLDGVSKESIQIGQVMMSGYNAPRSNN